MSAAAEADEFIVPPKQHWILRSWEAFSYTQCYEAIKEGGTMGLAFGTVLSTIIFMAMRRKKNRTFYKMPKLVAGEKPVRPMVLQIRGLLQPMTIASIGFATLFGFGGIIQGCTQPGVTESEKIQQQFEKVAKDVTEKREGARFDAPSELPDRKAVPKPEDEVDSDLAPFVGEELAEIAELKKKQLRSREALREWEKKRKEALRRGERLPAEAPPGFQ
eukprot:TRINITY_DN13931_c0_g1_i1.p1 TRINITY_DN13931_c0_g1~~TRINITY_DN13931_c0_g1_i1.p1  ORF type:complete len:218 (-),score=44.80 TRINITY_DN13931_c0_g1_i1:185-838(-)